MSTAEGRRRRRQRDGRPDGRAAARAPRARADRDLLDSRRQLPRPRTEPAAGGEPPADHRARARGRRRPRHRLGRRRRPLLLHRRDRRVRRRRLPHRAAGRVAAAQEPRRGDPVRRARVGAVPDTVKRAGGTPYINRVGHAFFKTRMREEGSLFGGEVSGHYYFRDFYCADSGTIPALLVLELLAREGKSMSELLAPYHARYFISGEINSEVADAEAKMRGDRRALLRRPPGTPRRHLDRLRGLALQRAPVEHRAAAAPVPGVARLARGHGAPARRGPRADPLACDRRVVSASSEPRRPSRRRRRARRARAEQLLLARRPKPGIHRLAIPTPFQVGRVNAYLIEDSPLTLIDSGPNSAKALDELEQALAAHGHAVEDIELLVVTHQHIDHFGLARSSRGARAREVAALDLLAPYLAGYGEQAEPDDRFARGDHAAPRHPGRNRHRAARGVGELSRLGRIGRGHPPAAPTARELRLRDRTLRVLHRPGHSPSDTVFLDESRSILLSADHLIKHISSNPLLAAPARRRVRRGRHRRAASDRRRWSPTSTRCRRRARWSSRWCCPATARRSSTTRS